MKPTWKRDGEGELDAELRAARPQPRAEFTRAIADRVRPRDSAGRRHFGRLQLALVGGMTALVLTPVVATGFGGFGAIGKSSKLTSNQRAMLIKAGSGHALRSSRPATGKRATARSKREVSSRAVTRLAPTEASFIGNFFQDDLDAGFIGNRFQNDLNASVVQYGLGCNANALIQSNTGTITQGGNSATGGNATSTGGNGGNANTGNTQSTNGTTTGTGGITFGGNTSATSGAATGGAGGSATSTGGSATAGNVANQTLVNNC